MHLIQQALHIFRKDVRHLRHEIALVLLIALAFAAMHARGLHVSNNSWLAEVALVIAAAFLIGRLVLAEAIPGDRQFWITRPYRWQSLLGAKFLFILTFVNLPVFLAHLFILIIDRFPIIGSLPGLLWSQVLLFTFVSLLFAALATLNSGLTHFIFSELIVLAAVAAIAEVLPRFAPGLGAVEWVRNSVACLALTAVAITVILVQYRSRRTIFSRWFAISGTALGAVLFLWLPWPAALALQSHFSQASALASTLQTSLGKGPDSPNWIPRSPPLHFPILVQGIPEGTEIQADALTVSFRTPDGRTTNLGINDCGDLRRESISRTAANIETVCAVEESLFDRARGLPVTFHASLYFTLFGNTQSTTIAVSDQPANALDGLQCYTDNVKAEWDVYCRSAFRWPARLVFAKLGHTNANSFQQIVSYSPFPATLGIEPVETRWASAYGSGPAPIVRDVTILTEEPLAHFRRDFETTGVRLDDFAFPAVLGVPPHGKVVQ
jgi:hypothetical protein